MNAIIDIVIIFLLWLILFVGAIMLGQICAEQQTQTETEPDPCDTCLRWPECVAVDADFCPQFPKGGPPDA